MIILMYYACVLRVTNGKKVYEYTDVSPFQLKFVKRWLKYNQVGRAWRFLKSKDCYCVENNSHQQYKLGF